MYSIEKFLYLQNLKKKTYTTSKKSIVISGSKGCGKTAYLVWHAFRNQNILAKAEKRTLKEQIKQEGYVSFYVDMKSYRLEKYNFSPVEQEILNTKFQFTEEETVFSLMHIVKRHIVGGGNRRLFSIYPSLLIVRYQC